MTSDNNKKSLRCKLKFHSFEKNIQDRQSVCKFCGHNQKLGTSQNLIGILLGVLIFGFLSVVIALFVFETVECFEVKQNFEDNQEIAREKHGFGSFEQWRKENGFLSSCGPKLDPGAF